MNVNSRYFKQKKLSTHVEGNGDETEVFYLDVNGDETEVFYIHGNGDETEVFYFNPASGISPHSIVPKLVIGGNGDETEYFYFNGDETEVFYLSGDSDQTVESDSTVFYLNTDLDSNKVPSSNLDKLVVEGNGDETEVFYFKPITNQQFVDEDKCLSRLQHVHMKAIAVEVENLDPDIEQLQQLPSEVEISDSGIDGGKKEVENSDPTRIIHIDNGCDLSVYGSQRILDHFSFFANEFELSYYNPMDRKFQIISDGNLTFSNLLRKSAKRAPYFLFQEREIIDQA